MRRVSLIILASIVASFSVVAIVSAGDINVQLQIPLPVVGRTIPVCQATGSDLECAGIAKYIAVIYRWLIGFAAVLAVLALSWGGVRWLTSGGESGAIQDAKKVIGNAIIGLLVALLSYSLLWAINPNLVTFRPIRITPISKIAFEIEEVKATIFSSGGGTNRVASMSANLTAWDGKLAAASAARSVDCTLLKALMLQESGGNPNAISPKGAVGLMQVMPGEIFPGRPSRSELLDPDKNTDWAANHVNILVTTACNGSTNGNGCDITPLDGLLTVIDAGRLQTDAKYRRALEFIAAAYNGGPGNNKYTKQPTCKGKMRWECPEYEGLYKETLPFTKAIVENFLQLKNKNWGCDGTSTPTPRPPTGGALTSLSEEDRPSPDTTSVAEDPSVCVIASADLSPSSRSRSTLSVRERAGGTCDASKSIQLELKDTGYTIQKYTTLGFPPPTKIRKITSQEIKKQWTEVAAAIEEASQSTGLDPGILGMYAWHESDFNYFQDNCDDEDFRVNTPCNKWDGYKWQVGLGVHTEQRVFLKEAFEKMYGNANPQQIHKVGQHIIDESQKGAAIGKTARPMKIISAFPALTVDQIIAKAERGTPQEKETYRIYVTTLMKDPKIGAYLIAKHLQKDIGVDSGLANEMKGWPGKPSYDPQDISNFIAGYQSLRKELPPSGSSSGSGTGYGAIKPK